MFNGFTQEAITFLTDLRLNNNQTFFENNKARYEETVKAPMRELCLELAPVIALIDPKLDTRPGSTMSRIRRDTRFSKDKSPFRDHAWLGWRYPGERRSEGFHMYWGFGPDWLGWGCGSYCADRPLMDAFRTLIRTDPDQVRDAIAALHPGQRYALYGEAFRKITIPPDVPEDLKPLYVMKYLGAESAQATEKDWEQLFTRELVDRITQEIHSMAPLVRLMTGLRTEAYRPGKAETAEVRPVAGGKLTVRSAEEFEF